MTVKVDLTPDVEAGLAALASERGVSLEAYVEQVLRERSAAAHAQASGGNAQKAQAFRAFARNHRETPPLSDESIRREHLVRDGQ